MNLKMFTVAAAVLVAASGATAPHAAPVAPQSTNACLIEGTVMSEIVKDCSQTDLPSPPRPMPRSAARIRARCSRRRR